MLFPAYAERSGEVNFKDIGKLKGATRQLFLHGVAFLLNYLDSWDDDEAFPS